MNRLQERFGEYVDFIHLNVDDSKTLPIRQEFGLIRQSGYMLRGTDGLPIGVWYGPLYETMMVRVFLENVPEAE